MGSQWYVKTPAFCNPPERRYKGTVSRDGDGLSQERLDRDYVGEERPIVIDYINFSCFFYSYCKYKVLQRYVEKLPDC
jgi:hypothetical protein